VVAAEHPTAQQSLAPTQVTASRAVVAVPREFTVQVPPEYSSIRADPFPSVVVEPTAQHSSTPAHVTALSEEFVPSPAEEGTACQPSPDQCSITLPRPQQSASETQVMPSGPKPDVTGTEVQPPPDQWARASAPDAQQSSLPAQLIEARLS
jgi:hypothetical protein